MKLPAPYKCDYCPKTKGENNAWWMRSISPTSFLLQPWDDAIAGSTNTGAPLYEHICSEECAHKALSRYLAKANPGPVAERSVAEALL